MSTGILHYFKYVSKAEIGYILIGATNFLFFAILLTAEIIYRKKMRNEVKIEINGSGEQQQYNLLENITKYEFHDLIHGEGRALVILDEFVIDVGEFMHKHPGGRFALKHNIGRDISKYFYGGYSLDGNLEKTNPRKGVIHSSYARGIVNELIIAYYEKDVDKTSTICRLREDKIFEVNPMIKTFYMQSVDKAPVPNFKRNYHGFEVLTKHFWIRTLQNR